MIDIVIPWVNPNDNEWQKDYNYWKEKETGEKNPCRFRDLETFNYWFRAIEKNCPWYRYIFLILASPSQIPSWLNVNHPRLKIVYHKDFIPLKELPTFNSSVINCYVPFIKELSDKYILFNDDMFAVKPLKHEMFFKENYVVGTYTNDINNNSKDYWNNNLRNGYAIFRKFSGCNICYRPDHGVMPCNKNVNLFAWNKVGNDISKALENSKFRTAKNVTDWRFWGFHYLVHNVIDGKSLTQYYNRIDKFNSNKEIFCFNDNESLKDFNSFKTAVINFLKNKFPNKSEFEK